MGSISGNGKTLSQCTAKTSLDDTDCFAVGGASLFRITWGNVKNLIKSLIKTQSGEIQSGNVTVSSNAGEVTEVEVTFPTAFSNTPNVVVSINSTSSNSAYGEITPLVRSISKTGFYLRLANNSSYNFSPKCTWIAHA